MKNVVVVATLITSMITPTIMPKIAFAASAVLAAEIAKCGGLISLEKNSATNLTLNVKLTDGSTCQLIEVDSLNISTELNGHRSTILAVDGRTLGAVLPITVNDELILMKLDQVQEQISSSQTPEQVIAKRKQAELAAARKKEQMQREAAEVARKQDEDRRKANRRAAAGAAALIIGGGALATDAVVRRAR